MARKQELPDFEELMEVSRTLVPPDGHAIEICPTDQDLNRFIAGHFSQDIPEQNRILKHLRGCARCSETLKKLGKIRHQARRKRILFTAAATAVIAALLAWFFAFQNTTRQQTPTIALLDLRALIPTRSGDFSETPVPVVARDVRTLKIVLPAGSEPGEYQVAVLDPAGQGESLFTTSAGTAEEGHELTLKASVDFRRMRSKQYLLAVRHGESIWKDYPFQIK